MIINSTSFLIRKKINHFKNNKHNTYSSTIHDEKIRGRNLFELQNMN